MAYWSKYFFLVIGYLRSCTFHFWKKKYMVCSDFCPPRTPENPPLFTEKQDYFIWNLKTLRFCWNFHMCYFVCCLLHISTNCTPKVTLRSHKHFSQPSAMSKLDPSPFPRHFTNFGLFTMKVGSLICQNLTKPLSKAFYKVCFVYNDSRFTGYSVGFTGLLLLHCTPPPCCLGGSQWHG